MDISVVIPLYNEEESLPELYAWIRRVMEENRFSYEIIFVDDGSTDRSWEVITRFREQSDRVKAIKFQRNYGKSPALHCAFRKVKGDVVITMDADLQDSPDEIPELYRMIKEENYDLVSGWKRKRYDAKLTKNLPSKLLTPRQGGCRASSYTTSIAGSRPINVHWPKASRSITICTATFPSWQRMPALSALARKRYTIRPANMEKASSVPTAS